MAIYPRAGPGQISQLPGIVSRAVLRSTVPPGVLVSVPVALEMVLQIARRNIRQLTDAGGYGSDYREAEILVMSSWSASGGSGSAIASALGAGLGLRGVLTPAEPPRPR